MIEKDSPRAPPAVDKGDIAHQTIPLTVTANDSVLQGPFAAAGGWLESVAVRVTGPTAVAAGTTYVSVWLTDPTGAVVQTLLEDYVYSNHVPTSLPKIPVLPGARIQARVSCGSTVGDGLALVLGWSNRQSEGGAHIRQVPAGPASGVRGDLRIIALGDPVANADYANQAVPAQVVWRPRAFAGVLVTDANVADRLPRFIFDDGATEYARLVPDAVQAASLTRRYRASLGLSYKEVSDTSLMPMPDVLMEAGHRFRSTTENRQATDNWDAGVLVVEEWAVP